jgi:hypothetical protein
MFHVKHHHQRSRTDVSRETCSKNRAARTSPDLHLSMFHVKHRLRTVGASPANPLDGGNDHPIGLTDEAPQSIHRQPNPPPNPAAPIHQLASGRPWKGVPTPLSNRQLVRTAKRIPQEQPEHQTSERSPHRTAPAARQIDQAPRLAPPIPSRDQPPPNRRHIHAGMHTASPSRQGNASALPAAVLRARARGLPRLRRYPSPASSALQPAPDISRRAKCDSRRALAPKNQAAVLVPKKERAQRLQVLPESRSSSRQA